MHNALNGSKVFSIKPTLFEFFYNIMTKAGFDGETFTNEGSPFHIQALLVKREP